jgi:hypothetical protein
LLRKLLLGAAGVVIFCFVLLLLFATIGPLVTLVGVGGLLGFIYWKWARPYDKAWRAKRGLSDSFTERVDQIRQGNWEPTNVPREGGSERDREPASKAPSPTSPVRARGDIVRMRGNKIEISASSVEEAQLALKELSIRKKELALAKRQIMEQERTMRAGYTDQVRRQGSKVRGGGGVGRFIRTVQTGQRDARRSDLAKHLEPLEKRRREVEAQIVTIDKAKLQLDVFITRES